MAVYSNTMEDNILGVVGNGRSNESDASKTDDFHAMAVVDNKVQVDSNKEHDKTDSIGGNYDVNAVFHETAATTLKKWNLSVTMLRKL